jgi:hypothetical protein
MILAVRQIELLKVNQSNWIKINLVANLIWLVQGIVSLGSKFLLLKKICLHHAAIIGICDLAMAGFLQRIESCIMAILHLDWHPPNLLGVVSDRHFLALLGRVDIYWRQITEAARAINDANRKSSLS